VIVPVMYSVFDSVGMKLGDLFTRDGEAGELMPVVEGDGFTEEPAVDDHVPHGGNGQSPEAEVEDSPTRPS
jgi:hypothetical protein